jgi:two-component system sensor histidine kinase KdpD
VTNLIDNAIKYSPNGGAIEVDLSVTSDDWVWLSVRDRGVGVPAQRRDKLFERFYRAHADDQCSGMGLGLFITHHLVELHGGSIQAKAPAGGGTRFVVTVPRRASSAHTVH